MQQSNGLLQLGYAMPLTEEVPQCKSYPEAETKEEHHIFQMVGRMERGRDWSCLGAVPVIHLVAEEVAPRAQLELPQDYVAVVPAIYLVPMGVASLAQH
jgi:hypothetical protein